MAKKIYQIKERYSEYVYLVIAETENQALTKYKRKMNYKMPISTLKYKQLYITKLKANMVF